MTKDAVLKELQTLIGVIANDNTLSLKVDCEGQAFIDYIKKSITLSEKCVPKALRVHPMVNYRFLQALAMHEAQHWAFMNWMIPEYQNWVKSRRHPDLGALAHNIVEDYRVNTWLKESHRWDIGKRVDWMDRAFLKCWRGHLGKILRDAKKRGDDEFLLQPVNFVTQGAIQCAVLGVEVDDFVNEWALWTGDVPAPNAIESVRKIVVATVHAQYMPTDTVNIAWQDVYRLLESHVREKWERNGDGSGKTKAVPGGYNQGGPQMQHVPVNFGGQCEVQGDKKDVQTVVKECGDDEGEKTKSAQGGVAGKGSGKEAPSPTPNEGEYKRLIAKNQKEITTLLNYLKRLVTPELHVEKYQRSGRLMTKKLARVAVQRAPQEYVHTRKRWTMGKHDCQMCVIVDMSGSMNDEDAQDVMTIIAEVGGQWLNESDLGLFVFGSTYKKVKAFGETYRNTRARIGGLTNLGGTTLAPCLDTVHRMYQSYSQKGRKRVCIIISDFWVSDEKNVLDQLKAFKKDGIKTIGVGLCDTNVQQIRKFTGADTTYVPDVQRLPKLFYDVYRESAMT